MTKSTSISKDLNLDQLIALRKGVRSCAQHPMSNFVSYQALSPHFRRFSFTLSSITVPRNVSEVMKQPQWRNAMDEQMKALERNKTWEIVDLLKGKKLVGCRWVFIVKYKFDGSVERYKVRLVSKGYTQSYGIDYQETFALVATMNFVRVHQQRIRGGPSYNLM